MEEETNDTDRRLGRTRAARRLGRSGHTTNQGDPMARSTGAVTLALLFLFARTPLAAVSPAQRCVMAKLKAASKKTAAELGCYRSARKKGHPVDFGCLDKAVRKFTTAFAKAEAQGGCPPGGNLEQDVDACVATLTTDEPGSGTTAEWTPLIGRPWEVPPGAADTYRCRTVEVPADLYLTGFRNVSPTGTYEMIVTVSDQATPTGDYDCSAATGLFDGHGIYASGLGTGDFELPSGVAVHVRAGQYLNLNVHVFNPGTSLLGGFSGVVARTIDAANVAHEAELVLVGTYNIYLPSDGIPHMANGGCSATSEQQVAALWPHLQASGTHATFLVAHGGVPQALLDVPYALDQQPVHPVTPPFAVHVGDQIQASCTYVNDTGAAVSFGQSTTDEQCFIGMYDYPAAGNTLLGCVTY
jgi:hypothetical protein